MVADCICARAAFDGASFRSNEKKSVGPPVGCVAANSEMTENCERVCTHGG
jgi:hypothetical protein